MTEHKLETEKSIDKKQLLDDIKNCASCKFKCNPLNGSPTERCAHSNTNLVPTSVEAASDPTTAVKLVAKTSTPTETPIEATTSGLNVTKTLTSDVDVPVATNAASAQTDDTKPSAANFETPLHGSEDYFRSKPLEEKLTIENYVTPDKMEVFKEFCISVLMEKNHTNWLMIQLR